MATESTHGRGGSVDLKRTIGPWGFAGVSLASFGGPLALAGLVGAFAVADAGANAGIVTVLGALVFLAPLAIWVSYSREVQGAGGLYDYVREAAGLRLALVQAAFWTVSYLLYVAYTTVQIVYDLLPDVIPGERHYQTLLAFLLPAALALIVIAGTRAWLVTLCAIGVIQLLFALLLAGITLAHYSPFVSGPIHEPVDHFLKPLGASSLLYICGSLPLFLGGEVVRPSETIRRGLWVGFILTVIVVVLSVAPLAGAPDLLNAPISGMAVVERFVGHGLAVAVGVVIALGVAAIMLAEFVALTRLAHAVAGWRPRPVAAVIGVLMLIASAISLAGPDAYYDDLIRPSLFALWISQMIVFAVYPRFARRHGRSVAWASVLATIAFALAGYGFYTVILNASS
jgi:hypothetical protein